MFAIYSSESLTINKLRCSAVQCCFHVVRGLTTIGQQFLPTKRIARTIFDRNVNCLDMNICLGITLISIKSIIVDLHFISRIQSRLIFDPNQAWIQRKK